MIIKFWGAQNKHGCFSNFHYSDFVIDGIKYPTVEHYYQSKKFEGTKHEMYIVNLKSPADTKKEGSTKSGKIREDWLEVRDEIMYKGIKAKFTQNNNLYEVLLSTGNSKLVENSPYDDYWGIGPNGDGLNKLGNMLVELRNELFEGGF